MVEKSGTVTAMDITAMNNNNSSNGSRSKSKAGPQLQRTASQTIVIDEWKQLRYEYGFGNSVSTEALPEALPVGCNNPQVCPYGMSQTSHTSSTTARTHTSIRHYTALHALSRQARGCLKHLLDELERPCSLCL